MIFIASELFILFPNLTGPILWIE